MNEQSECAVCGGALWVCEDHVDKPWGGATNRADACHCGGAGAPCPACNPSDREHPPKMPGGDKTILDKDGWRHQTLSAFNLPNHLFGILVLSQPDKACMPQVIRLRPIRKIDLGH